jgi:hypothetical protein
MELDTRHEEMRGTVNEFHKRHPEVWDLFVRFTLEMIGRGFSKYSSKAIFERIRWEKDAGGDGKTQFKLNNNYTAFYARRFMKMYPKHLGFFRTREQTSKDLPATNLSELTPDHFL